MFFRKKRKIEELEKELEHIKMHRAWMSKYKEPPSEIEKIMATIKITNLEDMHIDTETLRMMLFKECFKTVEENIDKYAVISCDRGREYTEYRMRINICKNADIKSEVEK